MLEDFHDDNRLKSLVIKAVWQSIENIDFSVSPLMVVKEVMLCVQGFIESMESTGQYESVACQSGCSYCCHSQVYILPLEALFAYSYITSTLNRKSIALLKETIDQNLKLTQGKAQKETVYLKDRTPCVFLNDHKCTIYPVRPFTCRAWNSVNLDDCISAFDSRDPKAEIDTSPARHLVFRTARNLIRVLCIDHNLESVPSTISQSMLVCLSDNDPQAAWSSGQRIFAECLKR